MIDILIKLVPLIIKWNILLTLAAVGTFAARKFLNSSQHQLVVRGFLLTALLAPPVSFLAAQVFEPTNIFRPSVQIAGTATPRDFKPNQISKPMFIVSESPSSDKISQQTKNVAGAALLILALTLIATFTRLGRHVRDRKTLNRLADESHSIREIGQTKILINSKITTPFAARLKSKALVVLPNTLLENPRSMNLAIQHELQHHRQRDLQWNTLFETARLIGGWNPLVRHWLERIEEIDELACDENLLGRGRIDVMDYATTLYEVALSAQTQTGGCARLVGTARMATSPYFLKRRIEMTLHHKLIKSSRTFAIGLIVSTTALTGAITWASESLVKDRRISQSQAETLASKTNGPIKVVVNKRVLNFLNLATGNPRVRFYMRNVLKRAKTYKPLLDAKLIAANMPLELEAIPAIEGGYQNTETLTAAGLWMFVPETARRYSLKVDDTIDERLDVAKETDAAIAYLSHNLALFQNDWNLTLLSYNMGERSLLDVITKTGERDVFKLADQGLIPKEECANYVPKIMAALIIMANPELVNE